MKAQIFALARIRKIKNLPTLMQTDNGQIFNLTNSSKSKYLSFHPQQMSGHPDRIRNKNIRKKYVLGWSYRGVY